MSLLPQQQPLIAYPETGAGQLLPPPSSQDDSSPSGSYTTVLIILAVIVIVCSIACFLGRFYGRRCHKPKSSTPKNKKKHAVVRPKEKQTDIEFGFDHKKIKTANRPVRYGDLGGHRPVLNVGSLNHGNKHFDHPGPTSSISDE